METQLLEVARLLPVTRLEGDEAAALVEALGGLEQRATGNRVYAALQRDQRTHIRVLYREATKLLDELGVHVAAKLGTIPLAEADIRDDTRATRWVERVLGAAALKEWAQTHLRPTFEGHWLRVAQQTVRTVNTQMSVGVRLPAPLEKKIIAMGGRRAGLVDLTEDTRRALYRGLAQAREEQLGAKAAAQRIRHLVPQGRYKVAGARYRAEMIARTETMHAQRMSMITIGRDADNITAMRAHDALIGHDEDCVNRDGRIFPFDAAEDEAAAEHPNGTLGFSFVVKGEKE